MPYGITEDQYQSIVARLYALEENHNNIAIAVSNFATLDQLQELLVLIKTDIDDLRNTVQALEDRITAIEEEPLD